MWKIAAVLAFALLVFVSLFQMTYRVGAEAILQPRTKRIIAAPFDGIIKSIAPGLDPGFEVKEDGLLVQFDTTDLEYSRAETDGKIAHARAQQEAALSVRPAKTDEAAAAAAQIQQYEAQLRFIDDRIKRSTVRAPIGGKVITGDLKNKIGAAVKLGDPMLEIADMSTSSSSHACRTATSGSSRAPRTAGRAAARSWPSPSPPSRSNSRSRPSSPQRRPKRGRTPSRCALGSFRPRTGSRTSAGASPRA